MSKKSTFSEKSTKKVLWALSADNCQKKSSSAYVLLPTLTEIFLLTFQKNCFSWTLRPIPKLAENPKIWHCYYWKCWVMTLLVIAVKNDSFLGPMTAGSGNLDFLWSQPLLQISPVLLVPQSCLKVQWLGRNRCPISWCVLNFVASDSTPHIHLWSQMAEKISNTHWHFRYNRNRSSSHEIHEAVHEI